MDMAKTAMKPSADQVPGTPTVPDFIRFGRAICGDLQEAERREWWLATAAAPTPPAPSPAA